MHGMRFWGFPKRRPVDCLCCVLPVAKYLPAKAVLKTHRDSFPKSPSKDFVHSEYQLGSQPKGSS